MLKKVFYELGSILSNLVFVLFHLESLTRVLLNHLKLINSVWCSDSLHSNSYLPPSAWNSLLPIFPGLFSNFFFFFGVNTNLGYVRFLFISVQSLSRVQVFVTPWTAAHQASLCITNSRSLLSIGAKDSPLSPWCHPTISSSVIPFSSCLQSFPASGSFQMTQFFTSGGQSIGVSASAWIFRTDFL